jgi:hypothetical protein
MASGSIRKMGRHFSIRENRTQNTATGRAPPLGYLFKAWVKLTPEPIDSEEAWSEGDVYGRITAAAKNEAPVERGFHQTGPGG